jgi:hypothetical protein
MLASSIACGATQPLSWATLVYCDNVNAVYLSTNPGQHQHTKHVEIDLHFIHERVVIRGVRVLHVPTTSQFVDIFTKGLPSSVFSEFRSSLNICSGYSFDCERGGGRGCKRILVLGPLGLRVYRVVGACVGRSPTPRLYDCNHSLEIN